MSVRPEATGSEPPTEAGVADEVTPDPGSAEAQEVPAEEALGTAASSQSDAPVGAGASVDADTDSSPHAGSSDADSDDEVNTEAVNDPAEKPSDRAAGGVSAASGPDGGDDSPGTRLARERLEDLQRLQAEYVNYKRRVDRDRALVQERAIADVLDSLLPVLDDIHAAREHGDLTDGPFASIADKLESSLGKFGLERFGATGEAFDPTVHEALLHAQWDEAIIPADPSATTVVQVLQPGYRTGQHVIRPARVSVADPE